MRPTVLLVRSALAIALVGLAAPAAATASSGIQVGAGWLTTSGVITKNNTRCDVSLIFASDGVIAKTTSLTPFTGETLVGGTLTNCAGGLLTGGQITSSGVSMRYSSFSGTLPNITGIRFRILGFRVTLRTIAGNCEYGGDLDGVNVTTSGGSVTGVDLTGSSTLPRTAGSALCPASTAMTGTLSRVSGTPPTVRLV